MAKPLQNYLRTYRKRTCFSQDELAFLLGVKSGAKVSRYESFARRPNFETALACQALLGAPASRLFAGDYQTIASQAVERARTLADKLRGRKLDRATQRKLDALSAIMSGWGAEDACRTTL